MRLLLTANITPFLSGGADHHINGLKQALQQYGHQVELIRFPFQFQPYQSIHELMNYCASLDLSQPNGQSVDRVISLQFPGYGVQHPDHRVWLMHQHRAVYELAEQQQDANTDDFKSLQGSITRYDKRCLSQANKIFANSEQVAERLQAYNSLASEALYHPPAYANKFYTQQALPYVFYPSRLESLKRQDLLIEAARHLKTPLKILLAGDGGHKGRYQELIKQYKLADRVRLLGHISEEEKLAYYAHALAVVFIPFKEDYGYITLEAMLSSKPVITATDSGGPLEFVEHEENGWVVEPDPEQLAEILDQAYTDQSQTRGMGQNARASYRERGISWERVVEKLTEKKLAAMKIAIVAPSGVPFVRGGAENLWVGMHYALNREKDVEAELIKLPAPERNLQEIIESYMAFAQLDLTHFDQVITTKYPAWMVYHHNHVVYLQHKLRGLYDTYQGDVMLPARRKFPHALQQLHQHLLTPPDSRAALAEVFYGLHQFLEKREELPEAWYAFPGPVSRAVVHLLDHIALAGGKIRRFCAISETVAQRENYFPEQVPVEVFYHPTALEGLQAGEFQYFFTASRLDKPKRIDLIIRSWLAADVDVPLYIAGTGPNESELKALAGEHDGIHFLGYVTDEELAGYYQNALAVLFVPEQEDYGLITLEAMLCGKAVLTVNDAGGVTELVKHQDNGWVTAAQPDALSGAIREAVESPELTKQLGQAGKAFADTVSWRNLSRFLVKDLRRKLVVVNTFPVYPARTGGQLRIFHLYRWLAQEFNVVLISLSPTHDSFSKYQIAPGFTEIRVPKSQKHQQQENRLTRELGVSAGDIGALRFFLDTPEWGACIAEESADADWVVASHPYACYAIRSVYQGEIIYESHNMEFDLKQGMIDGRQHADSLRLVEQAEQDCLREAALVTTCTQSDLERYEAYFGGIENSAVIPNGVDMESIDFRSLSERLSSPKDRLSALFMGSLHKPNILAAQEIVKIAGQCPEWDFYLLGSVCKALADEELPDNLQLLGVVDDAVKQQYLAECEVALNPMTLGSGSNLKVLEAAAAGQLIISTAFGGRGGVLKAGELFLQAEIGEFAEVLNGLDRGSFGEYISVVDAAYQVVSGTMDWKVIANAYRDALLELVSQQ